MDPDRPLIRATDLFRFAGLAAGSAAAALVPRACDNLAVSTMAHADRSAETIARRMASVLPARPTEELHHLAGEHTRMRLEDAWGRLRGIGPRRWTPTLELEGESRLREALQHRGAILWAMRLGPAIAVQQALHRAGLPLVHLSAANHGARSDSRFAEACTARLYRRAETPYLAGRVVFGNTSLRYIHALREALRRRVCVSIYGEHLARGTALAPFLGGEREFATGAPSLAWQEDVALFTVHAERTGAFAYRVIVADPIAVNRSLPRKEFARQAVVEFACRLQRLIEGHPPDWQGWSFWETEAPRQSLREPHDIMPFR